MRKTHHIHFPRLLTAGLFVAAFITQIIPMPQASAAQITTRSLTLQAGATDGGSKPGGVVNHFFQFNLPSGNSLGSVKFEYCTTAAEVQGGLDCDMPVGLSTAAATIGSQSGAATGFTGIDGSTTNGTIIISRAAANTITPGQVSYQLQNITNPTTANQTFHVRISTHASLDGSGAAIDSGTVTASTARQLELSGTMPESLVFCTGETVSLDVATSTVPDCSSATDGTIAFNQLFSPTDTATASSQMAASTNATTGYIITINGTTLTSGSNTIAGAGAAAVSSTRGTPQFGLNLRANATPAIGTDVAPAADGANYRGQAATQYNTADNFSFANGATVANSENGNAPGVGSPTNAQIFTVSYIVNVPGNQPAGTYTSTLTYVCTATF